MKTINLKIAKKMNGLTRKQLLYMCRLLLSDISEMRFRVQLFMHLTNIRFVHREKQEHRKGYLFRTGSTVFRVSVADFHSFLKSIDVFLSESTLTENRFPHFRIFWRRFYGPSARCLNISLHELLFAEVAMEMWQRTHKKEHLRALAAILYRPRVKPYRPASPGYSGDPRENFNDFTYLRRASWFRFLSDRKLLAVYLFFSGCLNLLMSRHPNLYSGEQASAAPRNPMNTMKSILFALNGDDITKNKEIMQAPAWEAIAQLDEMARKARALKRKK